MNKPHKGKSAAERYVQLPEWLLKSIAWRHLNPYARSLYVEFKRRYNGTNNGNISLSHREAQELLHCSNKPVPGAFKDLQDVGFIKVGTRGSFHWKTRHDGSSGSRATTWILTEYPVDFPVRMLSGATKEFMTWKPPEQALSKKTRPAESVSMGRFERTTETNMVRSKRANGTPIAVQK